MQGKWSEIRKLLKNQRQLPTEIEGLPIDNSKIIILPAAGIARIYRKHYLIEVSFDIFTVASSNQSSWNIISEKVVNTLCAKLCELSRVYFAVCK